MKKRFLIGAALIAMALSAAAANVTPVASIANLRAVPASAGPQYQTMSVTTASGVQCLFQWNASSSASDNGVNIVRPTDSSGAGRWICPGQTIPGEGTSGFDANGYLGIGGAPAQYTPGGEPPIGLDVISTGTSKKYFTVTNYGTTNEAAIHGHFARGTQASPSAPLSGDNICSFGFRAWDPMTSLFDGSSIALQCYLDENSVGTYTGSHFQIETTAVGSNTRLVNTVFNANGSMSPNKIGIGTTSPTNYMEVQQNTNGNIIGLLARNASAGTAGQAQIQVGNGSDTGQFVQYSTGFTTAGPSIADGTLVGANGVGGLTLYIGASAPMNFWTNNSKKMVIAPGGGVQMTAYGAGTATFDASGNITSVSDARLKANFAPVASGLWAVLNVSPVSYNWNDLSGMETKGRYGGFKAQDLVPYAPLATKLNSQGYYTLDDRALIATLWNAVRSLAAALAATWAVMIGSWLLGRRK